MDKTETLVCPECGKKFDASSTRKRYDTIKGRWLCSDNCTRDPTLRIYYESEDKISGLPFPWKLNWGIHCGTIMSRDVGDEEFARTREALIQEVERLKEEFGEIGYYLWYASIIGPNGKQQEEIFYTPYE